MLHAPGSGGRLRAAQHLSGHAKSRITSSAAACRVAAQGGAIGFSTTCRSSCMMWPLFIAADFDGHIMLQFNCCIAAFFYFFCNNQVMLWERNLGLSFSACPAASSSQLLGPMSTWCRQGKNKGPCQPLSTRSLNMALADMGLVVRGLSAHVGKRHVNGRKQAACKPLVHMYPPCCPSQQCATFTQHSGGRENENTGEGGGGKRGRGGADAPQPRPPTQMQRRQCTLGKGICEGGKGRAEGVCWWCAQRGRQLGWWGVAARGSTPPPATRETAV